MSYILDALRKADAQRARDPARGIHAQPAATVMTGEPGRRGRVYWLTAAIAAMIVVVVGWLWLAPAPVTPPPAVQAPAPPAALRSEPEPVAKAMPPANEVLPPPPPVVARVAPVTSPATAPAPAASAPAAPPPVAVAPATERTYSLAELPPDVQQALPKFNVTGGVYSENVAQRMLVVNGQVFNEGSEIAAGVVLEQIRPRVALLKFRGLRISQPY